MAVILFMSPKQLPRLKKQLPRLKKQLPCSSNFFLNVQLVLTMLHLDSASLCCSRHTPIAKLFQLLNHKCFLLNEEMGINFCELFLLYGSAALHVVLCILSHCSWLAWLMMKLGIAA